MCNPIVPLFLIAVSGIGISAVQLVVGRSTHGVIYHPISLIQEKVVENRPVISKSVLVPSGIAYSNTFGLQTGLHYTEGDLANGYASHVLTSNVAFNIPEVKIEHVPGNNIVSLLNYAVNAEPLNSGYTTIVKSVPVTSGYSVDGVSRLSRVLSSPQLDSTYNLNVLQSESNEAPLDGVENVKKAPLYTEAIFKPWPALNK